MRLKVSTTSPLNRRERGSTDWWSPNRDRAMFFAFFGAGVVVILALKVLVDSQLLVTAIPCALMLWYARLLWDSDESRPRYDSAGDNLYYLGFLYTLTSLAYSLYAFSADEEDTGIIVTNFGIAIATTILGMALRILLARPVVGDPASIEEDARLELAATARKLRAEMSYIVATFRESMEEDLRAFSRTVETFTQQMEQDLKQYRERLSQEAEEMSGINSKTMNRLQSVERSMERVEEGTTKAALSLIARVQELGESTSSIKSFMDSVQRLDTRIVETVETITRHSLALASGTEEVHKSLAEQAKGISEIDFRKAFDGAIKPASNELRAAATEFRKLLDVMRQADVLRERALLRGEKATAALQQTLAKLQELADAIGDALGKSKSHDFAQLLGIIAEQLSQLRENAGDTANQLSSVHGLLSESTRRIGETNAQLKDFSSILATITEQRNGGDGPRRHSGQNDVGFGPTSDPGVRERGFEGSRRLGWADRIRSWWRRKD